MNTWSSEKSNNKEPFHVILFCSRNKDNTDVPNFKQRYRSYVRRLNIDHINKDFSRFVSEGVEGEFCRLYISLNSRDMNKVKRKLIHELIDLDEELDPYIIDSFIASIAARKENSAENKWFFDFDNQDEILLNDFINDIKAFYDGEVVARKTPHGYAVIVDHGFDTRQLLDDWSDLVDLKRDDLICYDWRNNFT